MITFNVVNDTARLVLKRADRCNALTASMLEELKGALRQIESNHDIRVVLITAEGERFFSSGADVNDWGRLSPHQMGLEWIRQGNRIFQRLSELPVPVICGLQGLVLGGGAELALAADFCIASEDVELGFPETGIGAIPGWMGCARLVQSVGVARARSLVLSGDLIDAKSLKGCGLVYEVVPVSKLDQAMEALAERLCQRSRTAIAAAKQVFDAISETTKFAPVHELAASVCRGSVDGQEGVNAFREKRAPRFE